MQTTSSEHQNVNTLPRPTHSLSIVLVVAMLASLLGVGVTSKVASGSEAINHPSSTSDLLDSFEGFAPFRGIANDTLPENLDEGLDLGVVHVDFAGTIAGEAHDGVVDYGTIQDGSRLIAASDGDNLDRFAVIIDETATTKVEYRFDVDLPADATVTNAATGAIDVSSSKGNTKLAPALAVDVTGKLIPARYQLLGSELVLDVDLSGATLPVMVDPVTATYWWGTTTWYSRSDVRWQASYWSIVGIAKVACNWTPSYMRSACNTTVGWYSNWIVNTWNYARNTNQCLAMSMTWTGQVTSIYAYPCNWG